MEVIFDLRISITRVDDSTYVPSVVIAGNPIQLKPAHTPQAALLAALIPLANTSTVEILNGNYNL